MSSTRHKQNPTSEKQPMSQNESTHRVGQSRPPLAKKTPDRTARRLPFSDGKAATSPPRPGAPFALSDSSSGAEKGNHPHSTRSRSGNSDMPKVGMRRPPRSSRKNQSLDTVPELSAPLDHDSSLLPDMSPRTRLLSDAITPSVFSPGSGRFPQGELGDYAEDITGRKRSLEDTVGDDEEDAAARRKISDSGTRSPAGKPRRCRCKKSRCLKQYCECFKVGKTCKDCDCQGCHNDGNHEEERREAMSKLNIQPEQTRKERKNEVESRGCRCIKSNCQKRYCECFDLGLQCTQKCRCRECKNHGGPPPPAEERPETVNKDKAEVTLSATKPKSLVPFGTPDRSLLMTPDRSLMGMGMFAVTDVMPPSTPIYPTWDKHVTGATPSPMPAQLWYATPLARTGSHARSQRMGSPFFSPMYTVGPTTPDLNCFSNEEYRY